MAPTEMKTAEYETLGNKLKALGNVYTMLANEASNNPRLDKALFPDCLQRTMDVSAVLQKYNNLTGVPESVDLSQLYEQLDEEINHILMRVVLSQEERGTLDKEVLSASRHIAKGISESKDIRVKLLGYDGWSFNFTPDFKRYEGTLPQKTDLGVLLNLLQSS